MDWRRHDIPVLSGADNTVLVLGNGPVGQTTALLLARWGIPVVLLDRRPARDRVGSKSICQQRDVLDVWAWVGGGAIAAEGLTWHTARTFYQDRELFSVELLDPGRSPLPPFVNLSQCRTEEILDELIANQPLIDVRWSHEVRDLTQDVSGVWVTCTTPWGETTLQGAYAVAAGGGRGSALRAMLGVDFPGRSFDDAFLICEIRTDLPGWEQERRFYFDPAWNPGRQVLIHPCPDSRFRIDWQVEPDLDLERARSDGSLATRVRHIIGQRDYDLVWSSLYRFQARVATAFRVGRVLLAGDLAHLYAPFGARGLNSGVGDADNAAWKLAFVLHGWAPPQLLESYALERSAAARENLEVTTRTMAFLAPQNEAEHTRRHALLRAALTDPAARAEVDSGRLAEPFWYVDSPLTTPDATRPWPGRPPRGHPPEPVPGVVLPDAPASVPHHSGLTRTREVVRGAVTILAPSDLHTTCRQTLDASSWKAFRVRCWRWPTWTRRVPPDGGCVAGQTTCG